MFLFGCDIVSVISLRNVTSDDRGVDLTETPSMENAKYQTRIYRFNDRLSTFDLFMIRRWKEDV